MDDVLLVLHFIGLMLGAGGGFGSMATAAYAGKLPADQQGLVRGLSPILGRMSSIGLVVMLVTGFGMLSVKYNNFQGVDVPVTFWVKMVFVTTLTLAAITVELTYAAMKKGDAKAASRLPVLGPIAGVSSLLAVAFAALTFH
jgi:uncharacterized protein YqgC (DUF456 family)